MRALPLFLLLLRVLSIILLLCLLFPLLTLPLMRAAGSTVFSLTVSNSDSLPSSSAFSATTDTVNLDRVTDEFHEYADVFSKSRAHELAQQPPYDLKIELEDD